MLELAIRDFLADALSVPVYTEYPKNPDTKFVVLKWSGEGRENLLNEALLITDSYAETKLEAAVLHEQVKTVADELDTLNEISDIHLSTDYPVIDTGNKKYRYQAVYTMNHY